MGRSKDGGRPVRRRTRIALIFLSLLALAGEVPAGAGAATLTWAPPALSNPIGIKVSNGYHKLRLNPAIDYVILMPSTPLTASGGLDIQGGHNVVLIGGEINIPWQGSSPPPLSRRALYLHGQTGVVHIEGLRLTGTDIAEGIDLDERSGATVQLQNIRVEGIHARDELNFTDEHPDLIQTWGGPRELRVDRFTGSTDYQGFTLQPRRYGSYPSRFTFRNVNIVGTTTSRKLLWQDGSDPMSLSNVWVRCNPAMWSCFNPSERTDGRWSPVQKGSPPEGDFVPAGAAGIGYRSPGYAAGASASYAASYTLHYLHQPTGLTATTGDHKVILNWNDNPDPSLGLGGYFVYRNGTLVAVLGNRSWFNDFRVTPGVTYRYTVKAWDLRDYVSQASAAVTATP